MVEYMPRTAWTSSSASGDTLTGTKLKGVAVHWPGTTLDNFNDSKEAIASSLRHYREYHVNVRGWRDIGYNFAIDNAGRIWMLRSTTWAGNKVGAHCASNLNTDANHEYVGVLLMLGDREPVSPLMVAAFKDWYRKRFLIKWPGRFDVRGHGKVPGASTACPGPAALAAIPSFLATPAPAPTPTPTPVYKPPPFPVGLRPNRGNPCAITLQRALKKAGYLRTSVTENCNYGPLTQAAVVRFHRANPQFRSSGVPLYRDIRIGPKGWYHLFMEAYANAR